MWIREIQEATLWFTAGGCIGDKATEWLLACWGYLPTVWSSLWKIKWRAQNTTKGVWKKEKWVENKSLGVGFEAFRNSFGRSNWVTRSNKKRGRCHGQLVLKSSCHSGRVMLVLKLYPHAKSFSSFISSSEYLWMNRDGEWRFSSELLLSVVDKNTQTTRWCFVKLAT